MPPLPGLEPKPEPEPEEGAEEGADGGSQGAAGDASSPFSALAALSLGEGAAPEEALRKLQAQALAAHLSAEAPVFVPTVPSSSSLDKLAGSAEADAPSAEPAAASSS
jgi:collagen type V/XI/XXIV/XXVII alpha